MSSDFKHSFNPFRGCSPDELVLAYCFMSDANDHEGTALVAEAFNEDVWMDLREFNIGTADHP
jgi:hypothetical protein